jgi:hypothetical protein
MSKISLAPDASGTGIFTIASPNSNTNRTLTLPDALTGQPAQVVAIANTVWTAEVIAAYQAMLAEQANRVG